MSAFAFQLKNIGVGLLAIGLMALPLSTLAQSKRDRAAADVLNQRMTVAEAKYREALVKIGNNDPEGLIQGDSALEDMEDVITACPKQKGCAISQLLTTYKRLLKEDADARAKESEGEEVELGALDDSEDFPTGQVPQSANAAALLSEDGKRFVRMVQFNPAVQAGIRRWLTDMRISLMQSYENYQYMQHLMSPSFQRQGLPEALLFGILAKESNGKVHVGSRAGAVGPMQFMPATGRRFGLGPDATGFDTRYDPRAAADAAASYLHERFGQLNSNIELSLAAYNGGEGRATRVYKEFGGRSFWDADVYNQFPAETKDYVPMVIAAAWLYLHPKEYGLTFPRMETKPATIRLTRPASIYELTICLGNSGSRDGYMRTLRNLNPRYQAETLIPVGAMLNVTTKMASLYSRWCAQGARADLAKQLVMSDPQSAIVSVGAIQTMPTPASTPVTDKAIVPQTVEVRHYRVERGDTFVAIAQLHQCDSKALAEANNLKAPRYALRAGQRLKLSGCTN